FSRDWSSDVCSSDLFFRYRLDIFRYRFVFFRYRLGIFLYRLTTFLYRNYNGLPETIGKRALRYRGISALKYLAHPRENRRHRLRSEERRVGKECRYT